MITGRRTDAWGKRGDHEDVPVLSGELETPVPVTKTGTRAGSVLDMA
ncbi:hypothetical protein LptCag_0971 [Leptospirillum ferriphilum]|uniref:Uncharacterized protein n=1 Tax=Leptospirillum ferriphilum TaxID=178606 RepID=A0A094W9K9_9BACT|nr:hypothetical protein LptCag_0971 [Leptospirillum ferriphilum]